MWILFKDNDKLEKHDEIGHQEPEKNPTSLNIHKLSTEIEEITTQLIATSHYDSTVRIWNEEVLK